MEKMSKDPKFLAAHNRGLESRENIALARIAKIEQHRRKRAMDEENDRFMELRKQHELRAILYGRESSEAGAEPRDTIQNQSAKIKQHRRDREMEEEKERLNNLRIQHDRDATRYGRESSEPGAKTRNTIQNQSMGPGLHSRSGNSRALTGMGHFKEDGIVRRAAVNAMNRDESMHRAAGNAREMKVIERIKDDDIMRREVADIMTQGESTYRTEHQHEAMKYVQQQPRLPYSRTVQSEKSEAGNRADEKRRRSKYLQVGEL
jgi:hypothetical protein